MKTASQSCEEFRNRSWYLIGTGFIMWLAIGFSLAQAMWPHKQGYDATRLGSMLVLYGVFCPVFLRGAVLALRQSQHLLLPSATPAAPGWYGWGMLQYLLVLGFTFLYSSEKSYDDITTLLLTLLSPQLAVFCAFPLALLIMLIADMPVLLMASHHSPVAMGVCLLVLHAILIGIVKQSLKAEASKLELMAANQQLVLAQQQLARSVQQAERLRIARNLHDRVGHHLVALNIQLEVAQLLANDTASAEIARSQGIAKSLLQDVREVVGEMRHSEPEFTLAQRIENLIVNTRQWATDTAIHFSSAEDVADLAPDMEDMLFLSAQELLTNALKHGRPRNISITLSATASDFSLTVLDDGQHSDPDTISKKVRWGNGLTGIQERLASVQGQLTTRYHAQGFEAHIQWPCATPPPVQSQSLAENIL